MLDHWTFDVLVLAMAAFALAVSTKQRLILHIGVGLVLLATLVYLAFKHGLRRMFKCARSKPWETLEG